MHRVLSSLLQFFLVAGTFAEPAPLAFRHLTTQDGLPSDSVNDLLLDSRGFVWVGTEYGLSRYDGYTFKTFRNVSGDSTTLPSHQVRRLAEDRSGRLWVGTQSGLALYHRSSETFSRVLVDGRNLQITHLFVDSRGLLWCGTKSEGLVAIDPAYKFETVAVFEASAFRGEGFDRGGIRGLAETDDGRVWIASAFGLSVWDPEQGLSDTGLVFPDPLLSLEKGSTDELWVGSERGLTRVRDDLSTTRELERVAVTTLLQSPSGELWVGTRSRGLVVIDESIKSAPIVHAPDDPTSLGSGSVHALLSDDAGMIWVGTYDGGLSQHLPDRRGMSNLKHQPGNPKTLSSSSVFAVSRDRAGDLWVGTDAGLNRLNKHYHVERVYTDDILSHRVIRAIHEDRLGRFWVGTDGGLNLLDRSTDQVTVYRHDPSDPTSLSDDVIRSIEEDETGILWVGTNNGGLNRFDPASETFSAHANEEGSSWVVRAISNEQPDILWFASGGLFRYEPNTDQLTTYRKDAANKIGIQSNSVYDVTPDTAGGLWIGTYEGLHHFDPASEAFTVYTLQDGLPSDIIYTVILDRAGDVWMSTNSGISRGRRTDSKPEHVYEFRNFDVTHGVSGTDFNSGADFVDEDGTIYFGGMSGLTYFHPDSLIYENTHVPPVVITSLNVFTSGEQAGSLSNSVPGISERDHVALPSDVTHISVSFAALDYVNPARNTYAYRLEGLNRGWQQLDHQRQLNFSLSPGEYHLHILAANSDGVWNDVGRTLTLELAPPFWGQPWFIMVATIFGTGVLLGGHRTRLRRIRERNAELDDLVTKLGDRNAELERFTYTVSHDLKSPLVTIKGFVGLIEQDVHDRVRLGDDVARIREAADQMLALLDDLLELSRIGRVVSAPSEVAMEEIVIEAIGRVRGRIEENDATVLIADELPVVNVDRKRLVEAYQNLIDNAVKFSGDGARVIIGVRASDKGHVFTVRDNGPGIPPRFHGKVFDLFERLDKDVEGTGIGLALVHRIITLHGGSIWVESEGEGEGSTFCFTLEEVKQT